MTRAQPGSGSPASCYGVGKTGDDCNAREDLKVPATGHQPPAGPTSHQRRPPATSGELEREESQHAFNGGRTWEDREGRKLTRTQPGSGSPANYYCVGKAGDGCNAREDQRVH